MTNSNTGNSVVVLTDTDSCWVDVDKRKAVFLKNENWIVWVSERNGYRHLYLYNYEGNLINQITEGSWEITEVLGIFEADGWVYFSGKKDTPLEQHIYRVKLTGGNEERISHQVGWNTANFSPHYKYFVNEFSSVKHPSKTLLKKTDGTLIRILK